VTAGGASAGTHDHGSAPGQRQQSQYLATGIAFIEQRFRGPHHTFRRAVDVRFQQSAWNFHEQSS
jgi:hypothetical protein